MQFFSNDRWREVLGIHFITASFIFVHEIIAHPVCAWKILSIRIGNIDIYAVFVQYFFKRQN